jgi:hypothetical protein
VLGKCKNTSKLRLNIRIQQKVGSEKIRFDLRSQNQPPSYHRDGPIAYLKRTQDECIVYKHDPNVTENNYCFKMHVDANYALNDGNPERKLHSTTGYIATQNNVSVAH